MKIKVLGFLIAIALCSALNKTHAVTPTKCEASKMIAKNDIKKGKINFLIQGGIVSTYVKGQNVFEQKYKLKYFDFGCVVPKEICIADYNAVVGQYLDQKFGKNWRKEVRKDINGI